MFTDLKKKYNKKDRIKFNKNIKFIGGSGGSQNLIFLSKKYVYKIIPYNKKHKSHKIRKNNDQKEIKIYKILTDEFILKNKTPHIVGYYDKYKINLTDIFGKCPPLKQQFLKDTKKLFKNEVDSNKCILKKKYKNGNIKNIADVIVIEKCPHTIQDYILNILKSNNKYKYKILKETIDIVSFQVIFTLAVIQEKYPSFVHNDLFLRNIMGNIQKHKSNEFNEYKFKNKTFYLPATGLSIKINDFGETLSKPNMISTLIFNKSKEMNEEKINCPKCDLFNFFHDFYDGQDLGAKSVTTMIKKKSKKNKLYIRKVFSKYIDVNTIDKINIKNRKKFNWTWYINDIPFLKKMIKTPEQYLNSNIFNKYTKITKTDIIINKYSL